MSDTVCGGFGRLCKDPAMPANPSSAVRHVNVFATLDRWRIALALAVVAMHAESLGLLSFSSQGLFPRLAHDAVIGFFVVSGYSVMQAAASQRWQPREFLIGRWSRLYSLAIPALLLTLYLDALGQSLRPDLYPLWTYRKWWLHLGFHGLFLGEAWANSFPAFSNVPWWSLGYEAWYYLLLAAALMPAGIRLSCVALVLLCMGPRVWLLAPCWLMGVWAWRCVEQGKPVGVRWPTWLAPSAVLLFAYACWIWSPWAEQARAFTEMLSSQITVQFGSDWRLAYSRWFLADWVTAALFAATILALAARGDAMAEHASLDVRAQRATPPWIRALAFHSFGIYLLHYPLLLLAVALGLASQGVVVGVLVTALVIGLCVGVSVLCARTRPGWQRVLRLSIGRATAKAAQESP